MNKTALALEFVLLYVAAPLGIALGMLPKTMIMPSLWAVFLYVLVILKIEGAPPFRWGFDTPRFAAVVGRFVPALGTLALLTWWCCPERLFDLAASDPLLLMVVLIAYPLFSVIPQEIVFRHFFFYRYETLLNQKVLLLANAVLFAYVHVAFGNLLAVALTFIGGVLFALTYDKSRSLLLVSIEHALYGSAIFTLGLGAFFYHNGAV